MKTIESVDAVAVSAAPSADATLAGLVTELHSALDRLIAFGEWEQVSQTSALAASGRLGSAKARIESAMVNAADRVRAVTTAAGGSPGAVGSMLAGQFGGDRREGNALLYLGKQLADAPATSDSLAAGRVSKEQARVIARGLAALPPSVSEADRTRAERELLAAAPKMPLPDLSRRATRMREAFESVHDADAHENDQLVAQEQSAWEQSAFWMKEFKPGLFKGGFLLPEVQAQMLQAAVEAISAPRRFHLMDAGPPGSSEQTTPRPPDWAAVDVGAAPGAAPVAGWAPTLAQVEADLDAADAAEAGGLPLDKQHREGRALAQLCEHLPTDKLPGAGGVSAILTVNFDFETLAQGVRAATLSTGSRMSAGEVRRLACNAGLIPQVFDGASVPLDLGRSKRTFTIHQRRAIENRDGGCAMPGCDRPPGWCEGHHWRKPWAAGGTTNLDDLALLCGSDHRRVHAEGIPIRLRNGRLEFYIRPPEGGEKRWLSNRRFRMPPNAH
ncbi:HNH endonuclease [Branchiibius hedensis]|uniref:HNH endonuclease n=1 Tax=Branchiibius hedensis TaxID=672460 RepID=A0A2Y8ZUR8_9MICO|nr:HNH endonuclease signature motif containing protein [Branchiibius hedensis]PWJ26434.1 HNH endonuclease [Branchiibius hedensis]SSA35246.1 HNH endonuclease [Branchiibius hedensis]